MYLTGTSLMPDLSDVGNIHDDVIVRRMVALFDYDPWESSPNMDSEVSTIMMHGPHYCFKPLSPNPVVSFVSNTTKFAVRFQNIIVFPLFDSKAELDFRSGDIIYVLGDMDQDGFYYVSVNAMIAHKFLC